MIIAMSDGGNDSRRRGRRGRRHRAAARAGITWKGIRPVRVEHRTVGITADERGAEDARSLEAMTDYRGEIRRKHVATERELNDETPT